MSNQARRRLAADQTALIRALLAGDTPPDGFDPERLRVETATLLAKRQRTIERIRPDIIDILGARFTDIFNTWAAANPRKDRISPQADANEFATWLAARGHLP